MKRNPSVPRVMSTQHPDNVRPPFFADNSVLGGEDEIKEAFFAFSHLKAAEQLWDCEGKEVDNFVVKKLLSKYESYFTEHRLGKDNFLTLRVPNPEVEKAEAKILLETLESIPRSFDTAMHFYKDELAPIFEVALPMASNSKDLIRVHEYYKRFVAGKQHVSLKKSDIAIKDWIGRFRPEQINVIPLLEDKDSILNCDKIVMEFVESQKISGSQRVWLARSDPALNYGSLATVLMEKIALMRLWKAQEKNSIELLPIIGAGSAPFRGNFKPTNVSKALKGYPSVQTFTIQSAFKYDFPEDLVRDSVQELNGAQRKKPLFFEEKPFLELIGALEKEYRKQVELLAPFVMEMSRFVPQRRKRVLHVGLFGYSRGMHGIVLPRAIPFCAVLYSFGLPPDMLALNSLNERQLGLAREIYPNLENDLGEALSFYNPSNLSILPKPLQKAFASAAKKFGFEENPAHAKISGVIAHDFRKGNFASLSENIARAGSVRGFLG